MAFRREQQVVEVAGHARPDRFLLVKARERTDERLVRGHREMIRPKMHEPFDERLIGFDGAPMTFVRIRHVVLARELPEFADRALVDSGRHTRRRGGGRLARGRRLVRGRRPTARGGRRAGVRADLRRDLAHGAQLAKLLEHARGFGRARGFAGCALRRGELLLEPAARIACDEGRVARPGAEAESIGGDRRVLRQHRKSLVEVLRMAAYRDQRTGRGRVYTGSARH